MRNNKARWNSGGQGGSRASKCDLLGRQVEPTAGGFSRLLQRRASRSTVDGLAWIHAERSEQCIFYEL